MAKPVLGYWDIRGLAEPARLMLEYCGVEYEDKRYFCGDAPDFDRSAWLNEKFKLGLDFPNLPYYIDADVKLTESTAILKHIARKNGLGPISDSEIDYCNMMEGVVLDFRREFVMVCYMPNFDSNKEKFFAVTLPGRMELLDKYLASNKWLAGNSLTHVDFMFCEFLSHVKLMEPLSFDKYENVASYFESFFKLDKIAHYRQSSRFKLLPINGKIANWGGKVEK